MNVAPRGRITLTPRTAHILTQLPNPDDVWDGERQVNAKFYMHTYFRCCSKHMRRPLPKPIDAQIAQWKRALRA